MLVAYSFLALTKWALLKWTYTHIFSVSFVSFDGFKVLCTMLYAPADYTMKFYGSKYVRIAHIPINDSFTQLTTELLAAEFKQFVHSYSDAKPSWGVPNWHVSLNCDQH